MPASGQKADITRIERGFDFLGYHFYPPRTGGGAQQP